MHLCELLEAAHYLSQQLVHYVNEIGEGMRDIDRQLRSAGMDSWPDLEATLDTTLNVLELTDLLVKKLRRVTRAPKE